MLHDGRRFPSRQAWLEERSTGIGGSDAATILGLNLYKSAYTLWAEKVGLIEPQDLSKNEAVEWGHTLEPVIAEKYVKSTGRNIQDPGEFTIFRSTEEPFMLATLDRIITPNNGTPEGVLEIKTTGGHHADEWENDAPAEYQCQLQHQLIVTRLSWGSLAVLIGGQRFRYIDLERNEGFCRLLIEKEAEFWDRVQREDPPPPDASDSTKEALRLIYPRDTYESTILPGEAFDWAARRAELKDEIKKAQEELQGIENQIKAAIGAATFGVLRDGSGFKFAIQKRAAYQVAAAEFRVLREVKKI